MKPDAFEEILRLASQELKGDHAFMVEAMNLRSKALEFVSDDLRDSREFMLAALSSAGVSKSLSIASPKLWTDHGFMLTAVRQELLDTTKSTKSGHQGRD